MSETGERSSTGVAIGPPASVIPDVSAGFTGLLGLELIEATGTRVVARWPIGPHLFQPFGILHGGAVAAVVETLASVGGHLAVEQSGATAAGVSNTTEFFRPVSSGVLDVIAEPVFQGRSQQVWQVEFRDERRRLTARGNLRVQNIRDARSSGSTR